MNALPEVLESDEILANELKLAQGHEHFREYLVMAALAECETDWQFQDAEDFIDWVAFLKARATKEHCVQYLEGLHISR